MPLQRFQRFDMDLLLSDDFVWKNASRTSLIPTPTPPPPPPFSENATQMLNPFCTPIVAGALESTCTCEPGVFNN